jgi:hypothetical protein
MSSYGLCSLTLERTSANATASHQFGSQACASNTQPEADGGGSFGWPLLRLRTQPGLASNLSRVLRENRGEPLNSSSRAFAPLQVAVSKPR